jgi:hypothetical protein
MSNSRTTKSNAVMSTVVESEFEDEPKDKTFNFQSSDGGKEFPKLK